MNLFLQFLGLIFNLYFVFILSYNISPYFTTDRNSSQNHNKFKNKIVILLLILYILFDLDLLLVPNNVEITIKDGL